MYTYRLFGRRQYVSLPPIVRARFLYSMQTRQSAGTRQWTRSARSVHGRYGRADEFPLDFTDDPIQAGTTVSRRSTHQLRTSYYEVVYRVRCHYTARREIRAAAWPCPRRTACALWGDRFPVEPSCWMLQRWTLIVDVGHRHILST